MTFSVFSHFVEKDEKKKVGRKKKWEMGESEIGEEKRKKMLWTDVGKENEQKEAVESDLTKTIPGVVCALFVCVCV